MRGHSASRRSSVRSAPGCRSAPRRWVACARPFPRGGARDASLEGAALVSLTNRRSSIGAALRETLLRIKQTGYALVTRNSRSGCVHSRCRSPIAPASRRGVGISTSDQMRDAKSLVVKHLESAAGLRRRRSPSACQRSRAFRHGFFASTNADRPARRLIGNSGSSAAQAAARRPLVNAPCFLRLLRGSVVAAGGQPTAAASGKTRPK